MPDEKAHACEIQAPLSVGELIDKITILEIKAQRIKDPEKLRNITKELNVLVGVREAAGLDTPRMAAFASELRTVNSRLWDIEDGLRELEARQDFGGRFVELARNVYLNNDARARIKRQINEASGSAIVEEKSYRGR